MKEWIIGAGVAMALPIAFKMGKDWLGKFVSTQAINAIKLALEKGDDDDDMLIHSVIKWVEVKTEKLGAGDKPKEAAAILCAKFPILKGREADVADLIKTAIVSLEKAAETDKI